MSYQIPCGQNMGHGSWCVEERLCSACSEVRDLRGKLDKITAALGYDAPRQVTKDGQVVNISTHARFNLGGALEDLTNTNGNDEVTRGTIQRVIDQLHAVEKILGYRVAHYLK